MRFFVLILIVLLVGGRVYGQKYPEQWNIPELELPYNDVIKKKFASHYELKSNQYHELGFDSIQPYNPEYSYRILAKISNSNIYLLEKYDIDEIIHWLVILDENFKVKAWIVSAYDNSEGFLIVQSIFDRGLIIILESNSFHSSRKKSVAYEIKNDNFEIVEDSSLTLECPEDIKLIKILKHFKLPKLNKLKVIP